MLNGLSQTAQPDSFMAWVAALISRKEQIEAVFEIEGQSIFERDVVKAADVFTCCRLVGCCLTSGYDLGFRFYRKRTEAAVVEEYDFAVIVGDQVGKRQLDPRGCGANGLRNVAPIIRPDAREVSDQVCQIGPIIGWFGVQSMIPIGNDASVLAHFFMWGQGQASKTVRTS